MLGCGIFSKDKICPDKVIGSQCLSLTFPGSDSTRLKAFHLQGAIVKVKGLSLIFLGTSFWLLKKVRPYFYCCRNNYHCQQPSQVLGLRLLSDNTPNLGSRDCSQKQRHSHEERHLSCCDFPDQTC